MHLMQSRFETVWKTLYTKHEMIYNNNVGVYCHKMVTLGDPLNDHTASCSFLWNSGHLYFEFLDICAADNSVWLLIICVYI